MTHRHVLQRISWRSQGRYHCSPRHDGDLVFQCRHFVSLIVGRWPGRLMTVPYRSGPRAFSDSNIGCFDHFLIWQQAISPEVPGLDWDLRIGTLPVFGREIGPKSLLMLSRRVWTHALEGSCTAREVARCGFGRRRNIALFTLCCVITVLAYVYWSLGSVLVKSPAFPCR